MHVEGLCPMPTAHLCVTSASCTLKAGVERFGRSPKLLKPKLTSEDEDEGYMEQVVNVKRTSKRTLLGELLCQSCCLRVASQ